MTQTSFNDALESYGSTARTATQKIKKTAMVSFGAAAAGGLFVGSQADADVIHAGQFLGPVPIVGGPGTQGVDLDGDGDADIRFAHRTYGSNGAGFFVRGLGTQTAITTTGGIVTGGTTGGFFYPKMFAKGSVVSLGSATNTAPNWMGFATTGIGISTNPWGVFLGTTSSVYNTVTGYFGFAANVTSSGGGQALAAGWGLLQIQVHGVRHQTMTLLDWAYENAGGTLKAGQIPEPSSAAVIALSTLALGAAGMRRRKRKNA